MCSYNLVFVRFFHGHYNNLWGGCYYCPHLKLKLRDVKQLVQVMHSVVDLGTSPGSLASESVVPKYYLAVPLGQR